MKKWIYKSIFLIVFTVVGLFMLPKKEVKALQQGYPAYLVKTSLYQYSYERAHASTHEYSAQYVLEGIVIDTISDYFFTFKHYSAINKGYDNGKNSYELVDIEPIPSANATEITVRFTFTNYWLNQNYGGYDSISVQPLFEQNSAFYVAYDIYTDAYNEGYNDGFADGCIEGYDDGYRDGYTGGRYEGYNEGLDEGYNNGYDDGYNNGYLEGYINGRADGYNAGYDVGYTDGKEYGINFGREHWYNVGYEVGFGQGRIAGYDEGYSVGYSDGLSETTDKNFGRLLSGLFTGIGAFLAINLLPGISIGAIIAVPIVFGIITFILGRKKD